jgi:hypothetical protein
MRPRFALISALVFALVLVFVVSASADFRLVRTIPTPYGTYNLTGLDTCGDTLFAVGQPTGDCSEDCSKIYLIDPSDGTVLMDAGFPEPPPGCEGPATYLMSGAYEVVAWEGGSAYWAGDVCGDVMKFGWNEESFVMLDDFVVTDWQEQPAPAAGMVCEGRTLYIVLPGYNPIIVYHDSAGGWFGYPIWFTDEITDPSSITLHRGNFFLASSAASTIYELDCSGALVRSHLLEGWVEGEVQGVTFLGGYLYVASDYDSIQVFEEAYTQEVPTGDSVEVEIVPQHVTVTFDSVSTADSITAVVVDNDSCPPPDGVTFLPDFYNLSTEAIFEYAAEIAVSVPESLPGGIDAKYVRVFVRPSGECQDYRDITTARPEIARTLSLPRTMSEDDEFSVFVLGEDRRPIKGVIELKFENLETTIDDGQGSIPPTELGEIRVLLDSARVDYCHGKSTLAAERADSIAAIVRATALIPHTYDPDVPGQNLAGRLISDAHTLSFSLRFSKDEAVATDALFVPDHIGFAPDKWVTAYLEVPPDLDPNSLDNQHIYLEHQIQAVPNLVGLVDCDGDYELEIKAVFRTSEVKPILSGIGPRLVRITCFIGGYEIYADPMLHVIKAAVMVLGEGPYLAGSIQRVTWEDSPCDLGTSPSLWCSLDAGARWELVAGDLEMLYYDWVVPSAETDHAVLKITCMTSDGEPATVIGGEFKITGSAGVDDAAQGIEPRLAARPNPSSSWFAVEFALREGGPVEICIYSVRGELVKTLYADVAPKGPLALTWQGDNANGSRVSPGTYFVIARCQGKILTRKVILQR